MLLPHISLICLVTYSTVVAAFDPSIKGMLGLVITDISIWRRYLFALLDQSGSYLVDGQVHNEMISERITDVSRFFVHLQVF